ncbi:hypothetical protein [Corynebacterium alimapuense]|uniref:N-acetyltransferase n=1 Tax=Corynebacterium alimapuense TaxID=1576874 RepID=A0A3M8K6B9_9CORY|nr:hypothetical protein [Corynebacterium alimapuense]RNE48122.1 hypothetical protein C5L39_09605 [Corynebacterium alimapuense]
MSVTLIPVDQENLGRIHPQAARSIFWELDAETAATVITSGDPIFEKEAWLSGILIDHGPCGFSATRSDSAYAVATVFYCAREHAPGSAQLPTAPVSSDAELLSSLFIDPGFAGIGMEAVLIDAAIMELVGREISAIEAFGWRDDFFNRTDADELLSGPVGDILRSTPEIGLMSVSVLEAAGFKVVADHPVLPRLRLELPPQRDLLSVADFEFLRERVEAC